MTKKISRKTKMNKKGDKLLSVYWFLILVIVATGIVLMVNVFYGNPYDVREIESALLANKVADCIYYGGEVNREIFSVQGVFKESFRDGFMEDCSLNFDVQGDFVQVPYYIEVDFFSGINSKKSEFNITEGNNNLKPDCKIEVADSSKLAKCTDKSFFMRTKNGGVYFVKLLTIISKTNENTN